jgi:hypothetical protein
MWLEELRAQELANGCKERVWGRGEEWKGAQAVGQLERQAMDGRSGQRRGADWTTRIGFVVVCAEQRQGIVGGKSGGRRVPTHCSGQALALGDDEGGKRSRRRARVLDVVHETLHELLWYVMCCEEIERARERTGTVGGG